MRWLFWLQEGKMALIISFEPACQYYQKNSAGDLQASATIPVLTCYLLTQFLGQYPQHISTSLGAMWFLAASCITT